MKNTAIVLAAGSGSRMKSKVKKQYLLMKGKPVLYYALAAFQKCDRISEIILVCGKGEREQCETEIVRPYGLTKVSRIVEGGKERYHSVHAGLKAVEECDYALIHDGARPFVDEETLNRVLDALPSCQACVVGMPVKDTIKMAGESGCVERTLPREKLWAIQTPQAFSYPLIRDAYDRLEDCLAEGVKITDDAMVAEYVGGVSVKLIEGSYNNIKITTPEDLILAEYILEKKSEKNC